MCPFLCYNIRKYSQGETILTIKEQLDVFSIKSEELIASQYIIADVKIASLLKTVASSDILLALFKNCLTDFDYGKAKKSYLVKSQFLADDKGEFVLPPNSRELLAFVFSLLIDIDAKRIIFSDFLNKYFFVYGSLTSSYNAFINTVIKPFKNSVEILIGDVIEGKIQDPIEALVEEEARKKREKEEALVRAKKDKELSEKAYGESVKAIREMLLLDKKKVKDSKLKDEDKQEIILVIDMLANVIESEDKDAINYAFIAYKYVAKSRKRLFFRKVKKINKHLRNVLNGI